MILNNCSYRPAIKSGLHVKGWLILYINVYCNTVCVIKHQSGTATSTQVAKWMWPSGNRTGSGSGLYNKGNAMCTWMLNSVSIKFTQKQTGIIIFSVAAIRLKHAYTLTLSPLTPAHIRTLWQLMVIIYTICSSAHGQLVWNKMLYAHTAKSWTVQ